MQIVKTELNDEMQKSHPPPAEGSSAEVSTCLPIQQVYSSFARAKLTRPPCIWETPGFLYDLWDDVWSNKSLQQLNGTM